MSGDYYLVASFTAGSDRQDFTGVVGSIFTASKSKVFNRIGARRGPNSNGIHKLEFGLWNAGTLQPSFQASIDFSTGAVGDFIYAVVNPFFINAGDQCYLGMVTVANDGNQWSNDSAVTLNDANTVYSFYSPDGTGHLVNVDFMYVGVDIAYKSPDLLAHWTFDGGAAADSSGQGNDGTLVGGPTAITGRIGGALSFNGSGQYVTTPLVQPSTSAYSISCWFSTFSGFAQFITNNRGPSGAGISIDLAMNNGTYNEVDMFINANALITGISVTASSIGDDFCNGKWRHLVGVFNCPAGTTVDTTHFTLYLDKVQLTPSGTFSYQSTTSPVAGDASGTVIGGSLYAGDASFNGGLDDIWIYNHALTPTEIAALFDLGAPASSAVGHADGVATVTGHGAARIPAAGHAAGAASVAGTIKAVARASGAATGTTTVAGNTHALARSAGHADGHANVAGLTSTGQLVAAVGNAAGHATVAGIAHSRAVAAGNAAGTAIVAGVSAKGLAVVGQANAVASVAGVSASRVASAGHVNAGVVVAGNGGGAAAAAGQADGHTEMLGVTRSGTLSPANGYADGLATVWGVSASTCLFQPLGVTAPLAIADANPFQLGLVRSSAAVDWWYGEDFQFQPKASGADVNAPAWNDPRRAPVQITAVLTFPYERGGQGRIAMKTQGKYNERPGHASLATRISFSVAALPYAPLRGDQLYRFADATTWQLAEIHRPDSVRIIADVTMVSTGSVAAVIGNARVAGQ